MVQVLALLLGIYILYKILKSKANYVSFTWVVVSSMLINGSVYITRFPVDFSISRWLTFSLLGVLIIYTNKLRNNWKEFPLKRVLFFVSSSSFLLAAIDPRLSTFEKFYTPFRELTETYGIIFLGYCTIKTKDDLKSTARAIYLATWIIATYGIFNFITQTNPYYEFVLEHFAKLGDMDLEARMKVLDTTKDRFRAVSTFNMTFNYGYISSLIAIFFLAIKGRSKYSMHGVLLGLVGTLLCFSRTVFLAAVVSFVIYILLAYSLRRMWKIFLISLFTMTMAYSVIPPVQETVDNTVDLFFSGGSISGSSVEVRETQLIGAYYYFQQSPIFGNGYGYINKELGWADRDSGQVDKNMYGFESIVFQLMIEQGLVGLVSKFLFFIVIILFFFRRLKTDRQIAALGISLTMLFVTFSVGTGVLGAWPLTMLFLGATIKTIQVTK